ncbi:multicopper oxidase family protein [Modestobacter sp. Leaf380]|uniref:multicopper oxidase family protein n=1 Tax=Modestobacter sp. Leaf380 TaxID=1736356 RepID=UPI0006F5E553|nr:multicopper oxidase family protein [Modestobacter sp. Leaf380]KQS64297.1 copper oxidase [Modestobacter sp. Leaf380]
MSISRRTFLGAAAGSVGAVALAACSSPTAARAVGPGSRAVAAAEAARATTGATTTVALRAGVTTVDLGGTTVSTWAFNDIVPGPEIRVRAGDQVVATVTNELPATTSVHWHGLALRNDMDGVPGITQRAIAPGADRTYRFTAPNPGTYFFHPHVGVQLDRGLYAPLIVEDPAEPLGYDADLVVVLDDWIDGTGTTPDDVLARLTSSTSGMGGMGGGGAAAGSLLGGDGGDVAYPHMLINGRTADAPATATFSPGARIRLRIINAGADTAFRVAVGGHRLTLTHTDGFPVDHTDTDAVLLGMGERADCLITLTDGAFPLIARAEGKNGAGLLVLRTSPSATAPTASTTVSELDRQVTALLELSADPAVGLADTGIDRELNVDLGGGMAGYRWTINGRTFDDREDLHLRQGERVRLTIRNQTMMFHPLHVHGHTLQVRGRTTGPRKDTMLVVPGQTVIADLAADNPGQWLVHCHNAYHGEAGMMTVLSYTD